jgi:hypothetical protein
LIPEVLVEMCGAGGGLSDESEEESWGMLVEVEGLVSSFGVSPLSSCPP